MSIETDFRALLAANAGLSALVGTRIAQNAVPAGSTVPLVVFGAVHERQLGLDNTLLADRAQIVCQCWAETSVQADAVAGAGASATAGAVVLDRASSFDNEMGLHATELTVEWWA
jgi:hypothetical protein